MNLHELQDENTRYICIGPVNKALNLLCCYFEDPSSVALKRYVKSDELLVLVQIVSLKQTFSSSRILVRRSQDSRSKVGSTSVHNVFMQQTSPVADE